LSSWFVLFTRPPRLAFHPPSLPAPFPTQFVRSATDFLFLSLFFWIRTLSPWFAGSRGSGHFIFFCQVPFPAHTFPIQMCPSRTSHAAHFARSPRFSPRLQKVDGQSPVVLRVFSCVRESFFMVSPEQFSFVCPCTRQGFWRPRRPSVCAIHTYAALVFQ